MIPRRTPYENSPPLRDNIVTVAMPGITSTRAQISRYTGPEGVPVLANWSDRVTDVEEEGESKNNNNNNNSNSDMNSKAHRRGNVLYRVDKDRNRFTSEDVEKTKKQGHVVVETLGRLAIVKESVLTWWTGKCYEDRHNAEGEAVVPVRRRLTREEQLADEGAVDPPLLYTATCRVAPRLMHNVIASPEMSEIVHLDFFHPAARSGGGEKSATDGDTDTAAPPAAEGGTCMSRWEKLYAFATNPFYWLLCMKEIATGLWFSVRPLQFCYSEPGRTNLAGVRDQHYYTREIRRAVRKVKEAEAASGKRQHIVLFGVSRGATACFYAAMKLPKELAPHISLVLVEGAFNTLYDVIHSSSFFPNFNMWFFRSFCDYRGAAEEAEAFQFDLAQVQLRCPVAFVISVKDTRVPNSCTMKLVDLLREHLVPHVLPAVEVLVLQHSRHPCMAVGHKEDQDAYVQFTERLYNTYCS